MTSPINFILTNNILTLSKPSKEEESKTKEEPTKE